MSPRAIVILVVVAITVGTLAGFSWYLYTSLKSSEDELTDVRQSVDRLIVDKKKLQQMASQEKDRAGDVEALNAHFKARLVQVSQEFDKATSAASGFQDKLHAAAKTVKFKDEQLEKERQHLAVLKADIANLKESAAATPEPQSSGRTEVQSSGRTEVQSSGRAAAQSSGRVETQPALSAPVAAPRPSDVLPEARAARIPLPPTPVIAPAPSVAAPAPASASVDLERRRAEDVKKRLEEKLKAMLKEKQR